MIEVERGLLDALRVDPEDEASWQVLADWLTQRGDARGQLIRIEQRLRSKPGESALEALASQAERLRSEHESSWLAGLIVPPEVALTWQNGFVVGGKLAWNPRRGWDADLLSFFEALGAHPTAALLHTLDLTTALGPQSACGLAMLARLPALDAAPWTAPCASPPTSATLAWKVGQARPLPTAKSTAAP